MNSTQYIPPIIHQIWSEKHEPLPEYFRVLGQTWKANHLEWCYRYWNDKSMYAFLEQHYPEYVKRYKLFTYDIQRWDAIRYLILFHYGGIYVDFDYECLKCIEPLLKNVKCCFAMEPMEHVSNGAPSPYFNNALMGSVSGNGFMQFVVKHVFERDENVLGCKDDKSRYVLNSTGPLMLSSLYHSYPNKEEVTLLPASFVSPFSCFDSKEYMNGNESEYLDSKLKDAYAVHYFLNTWSWDVKTRDEQLLSIAQQLLVNAGFTNDLGLFHGRMGIVLFLCQYSRYSGNLDYDDFAGELFEMINEDLREDIAIGMENGLSGIGWGVEYLARNGFISGDTDDLLEDIDIWIMKYDPMRMCDYSFGEGFLGIVFYVLNRLFSKNRDSKKLPFELTYLEALYVKAKFLLEENRVESLYTPILTCFCDWYEKAENPEGLLPLSSFWKTEERKEGELGITKGLASKGLKLLSKNGITLYI